MSETEEQGHCVFLDIKVLMRKMDSGVSDTVLHTTKGWTGKRQRQQITERLNKEQNSLHIDCAESKTHKIYIGIISFITVWTMHILQYAWTMEYLVYCFASPETHYSRPHIAYLSSFVSIIVKQKYISHLSCLHLTCHWKVGVCCAV